MTFRATTFRFPPLGAAEHARAAQRSAPDDEVLALFDRFRDPLLRYVCAFGMPINDGEDVIQEVFLALFRHLRRDGSRENLPGWLFRVAHNLALKRRALLQRERGRIDVSVDAGDQIVDPDDNPEARFSERQERRRLRAVFNALPDRDRHCIRLRGEGLRYREIAQVLGISLGAVAKSVGRAVARLQRVSER